jgi:hypothetical protein
MGVQDFTAEIEAIKAALEDAMKAALENAHERGREAGRSEVMDTIQGLVRGTLDAKAPAPKMEIRGYGGPPPRKSRSDGIRAPRGRVGTLVDDVLGNGGAMRIVDLEAAVVARDGRIAPKSVGNHVRRLENERYRRSDADPNAWELIPVGKEEEAEDATNDPSASLFN